MNKITKQVYISANYTHYTLAEKNCLEKLGFTFKKIDPSITKTQRYLLRTPWIMIEKGIIRPITLPEVFTIIGKLQVVAKLSYDKRSCGHKQAAIQLDFTS